MMRALGIKRTRQLVARKCYKGLQLLHTDLKDISHDTGGIAYVYRLKGHELRFDPRRRRPAGTDKSMHLGGRK